jgi:alpha-L-fucosidase
LHAIGAWLRISREAIYGSHPADRYGEGETIVKKGLYVADRTTNFTAEDIRLTTRDGALYVLVLGAPAGTVHVKSLRRDTPLSFGMLRNATLLGSAEKVRWTWSPDGLTLDVPETHPAD